MEVKRIGKYLFVDEQGYLVNSSNLSANQAHWLEVVNTVKSSYLDKWSNEIHSIYIRGSLAKGLAVDYVSDVDSFAVLKTDYSEHPDTADYDVFKAWALRIEEELTKKFPFVTGLEASLETFEGVFDRNNPFNSIIKTSAACICGEDLAGQIDPYKIDHHIAFQVRYFEVHLNMFLTEYPDETEEDKLSFVPWLMRRFLRLGMEFVMEAEQKYTRDLYLCFESFSKHYPEQKSQMYQALDFAINPQTNDKMLDFAKSFGVWLVKEANRKLLSWGYIQTDEGKWVFSSSEALNH